MAHCGRCNAENPDGKRFCGDCGTSLAVSTPGSSIDETMLRAQVDSVLNDRYKDQRLVELEITQAIAARLSDWAKLFGFFVGIPLTLLLLVLSVLGFRTYSDFVSQIRTVQQETTAQLTAAQASAAKLKNEGESLAKDYDKLRVQFRDTSAIAEQLTSLSQRVDRIGEKLGFTAGSKLSAKTRAQLESEFGGFQSYLQSLGYKGIARRIDIDVREKMESGAVAFYDGSKNMMVIDANHVSESPVVYREYMHHVLYGGNPPNSNSPYVAIESGLAWYFPCSFVNNPHPVEWSPWDLSKKRPLADIHDDIGSAMVDGTEIWGSIFWEIRQLLGQKAADALLFDAWFKLSIADAKPDHGLAFARLLMRSDAAHASQLGDIFKRRGAALL